ncbi:hypothetical protein [Microbulbifer sp. VAAF005]|uniref:hypothetical protein n=1 Tax=Microbulbifer sp. VAAF005 TaxID=3034230 RepID=UPI0024AC8D76|nr:hypothetical protein [Microbulbifer sp. VAAF005]WHI45385.1 hypothetical protein P0078_16845 [Microbulbifer sp. VAAF005]
MQYESGEEVRLGDIVEYDVDPNEYVSASVVMLGEDYSHSELEESFLQWVTTDNVLENDNVVVEVEHEKGNYMFTTLCCVKLLKREGV